MCQLVFGSSLFTVFHLELAAARTQGGLLLIKRPRTHGRKQPPGHCPINQVVNVINGMWEGVVQGQMKHVQGGLLSYRDTAGGGAAFRVWAVI